MAAVSVELSLDAATHDAEPLTNFSVTGLDDYRRRSDL